MPIYLYQHPKTKEIKSIFQKMLDEHVYSEDGIEWNRVFTLPMASVGTKVDPFSSKQFIEQSAAKKGTIGDLIDQSRELSAKREKVIGTDPLKEKYLKNWSKKRGGRLHPDLRREQAKQFAAKNGFELEL